MLPFPPDWSKRRAADDLRYEVDMLRYCHDELTQTTDNTGLKNVLTEAYLIHVRSVLDFLCPTPAAMKAREKTRKFLLNPQPKKAGKKPASLRDDVLAADFCTDWDTMRTRLKAWKPITIRGKVLHIKPADATDPGLCDFKALIDKTLPHLTYSRPAPEERYTWPIAAIAAELDEMLKVFVAAADPAYNFAALFP